jgi:Cytidine deaminase
MEEKKIEFTYKVLKTEELSADDALLRRIVIESAGYAYAPYSKYNVGAAVVIGGGGHVRGNNQENAVYPLGICAERLAIFNCMSKFPQAVITTMGVVAVKDDIIQPSVTPCGACRQVLLETELNQGEDIRIVLFGNDEAIIIPSAKDLLPLYFEKNNVLG